ncbi:alcohol dehydrogenase [Gammaproteobacteria bacterium 45_16_T64]|nr:alcohol dehydrogenase [Gammaproteobacteria bacterium 45_16_T64]
MSLSFEYHMPTRIIFGAGKLNELDKISMPGRHALVVMTSGQSMKRYGYLDKLIASLTQADIQTTVFAKVLANPVVEHVHEAAEIARQQGCDFIIGFGGGSAVDTAKSVAVMVNNPGDYWDYIGTGSGKGKAVEAPVLPIVAIPTTAGTGTESDPWTVITKTDSKEKIGFGIPETFPQIALVDPELMVSVPPKLTAYQGMDAFFHAAEGYLASIAQPASELYSLDSVARIQQYLPRAVTQGDDIEARSQLAWASTQSGMVESTSCVISHHSLEHALSAYYPDVPHGAGLVMLSIPYFTFMANHAPSRFVPLAKAMGAELTGLTEQQQALAFVEKLKQLIADVGLADLRLRDFDVKREDMDAMAQNAFDTMGFLFDLDPHPLTKEDIVAIYEASYA